jgi:membrane protease YdiL (CAAX protease family)
METHSVKKTNKTLLVFFILLGIYALMPLLMYGLLPLDQVMAGQPINPQLKNTPGWLIGLYNTGIILVVYGLLGLAGLWFARKLRLPGIFREGAALKDLVVTPLWLGALLGVVLTVVNIFFSRAIGAGGLIHPQFPVSIFASVSAGIGEEIMFRMFLFGLWAFLLNLLLRRWNQTTTALWIANVIAALAFSAAHLPSIMILYNLTSMAQIPPLAIVEVFLLNSIVGLVAGQQYIKNGLVSAVGIHFWTDVVLHVILPLILV